MKFKQVDFVPDVKFHKSSFYRDFVEEFIASNIKCAIVTDFGDNVKKVINSLRVVVKNYPEVEVLKRGESCYLVRR